MRFNFKYHSLFSDCILLNSILKYHGIQCGNRIKYEKQKKRAYFRFLFGGYSGQQLVICFMLVLN